MREEEREREKAAVEGGWAPMMDPHDDIRAARHFFPRGFNAPSTAPIHRRARQSPAVVRERGWSLLRFVFCAECAESYLFFRE